MSFHYFGIINFIKLDVGIKHFCCAAARWVSGGKGPGSPAAVSARHFSSVTAVLLGERLTDKRMDVQS